MAGDPGKIPWMKLLEQGGLTSAFACFVMHHCITDIDIEDLKIFERAPNALYLKNNLTGMSNKFKQDTQRTHWAPQI